MIVDFLDPKVVDSAAQRLLTWLADEKRAWQSGQSDSKEIAAQCQATADDAEKAKDEIEQWRKDEVQELSRSRDKPPIWVPRNAVANLLISEFDGFFFDKGLTVKAAGLGFAREKTLVSDVQLSPEALEFLMNNKKGFFPRFGQLDARFLTWGAAAKISTALKGGRHVFPKDHGPIHSISETKR